MHSQKAAAKQAVPQGLAPPGTGQCFGRETELELLDSLMGRARDGTGASFVLLSGPGGIGKSTLMAAARHRLQGSGAMVLEGWCSPGRPSYAPVLEVVRRALQVLGRSGDGVAESFATWRDCLAILEGESLPSGEQSDPRRTPEAARINLFDQLAQSLSMLSSTRPLAVVLHDLDLADHGTLDLVRFLGSMLTAEPSLGNESPFHGLLIATASDPAPLLCEPGWADQVRLMELELSGLNEEAVQRYLSSGTVVKTALAATGGNPRLLDAIFQTAPERLSAGPRLTGVAMVERVPGAVEVLRLLAVAGRPLGVEELGRLTQLDQPALSGAVAKLVNAGLVDKSFREGELLLSYAHSEDQSVAYQEINSGERAALHVRIADHLEAMGGDQELEACADHLLRAGVGERAVSLCLEAGQRLEIALSFSRAIELYERALPMAARRDQKVALLEKLCSLLEMTGKLDSALAHADGLAGLLPGDPHVALRIANLNLLRNDFLGAEQVLDGISLDHGSSPDSETRCIAARVLAHRAEARFFAGDTEAALDAAMEGLSLCEDSGEEALALLRITLLNTVTKLHLERGDDAGAHRCATEALALARAAGRVAEELRTLGLLGQQEMNRAEYAAAEDWYQQARTLAEAVGEHRLLGVYLQHLGVLAERRPVVVERDRA